MTFTNDPPAISSVELIPDADEKADLNSPSGSGGKLVIGQAPNITITETTVVADAAERLALEVQEGDIAVQTNVSTSFIFTGGDNVANNWQALDFDAVGAISGEAINPSQISGANISTASAGDALTSDGSGNLSFASVGGIETVAKFDDLPAVNPPQIAYVESGANYYVSKDGFTLSNATYDNVNLTSEGNVPTDMDFSPDGTVMFTIDQQTDLFYQYSLSTGFDLSTASFDNITFPTRGGVATGMSLSADGTAMFECNRSPNVFHQYSLSTPFDLSTASYDNVTLPIQETPRGMTFSTDGTKVFEAGAQTDTIYQYSLSTPFDLSTGTFDNVSLESSGDGARELDFTSDGLILVEVDTTTFYQSVLSTPYDLSTARSTGLSLPTQGSDTRGMAISDDKTKLFECGFDTNKFHQYSMNLTGEWNILT